METENKFAVLLESHGVKATANRIVVVRALAEAGRPLSLMELERRIVSIDKSGVFRALTLFREHRLVHTIDDGSGGTRFELCHSHDADCDDDVHPHFFCERCRRTLCLSHTALPQVSVPTGFVIHSANYLLKGLCPECAMKRNDFA
jgi:Fur family ferric uptake transcriptional regulator